MALDPITKVAMGVAVVPTALASGSIGIVFRNAPPRVKEAVERTNEKVNALESELGSQLDSLIKDVVGDNVEKLKRELQTLESEVQKIERNLDLSLQTNSQNLKSNINGIRDQLRTSISTGENNLHTQLQRIEQQLKSSESQLNTQLTNKSQNLGANVDTLLTTLKGIVNNKIQELRKARRTVLEALEKKLASLEKDTTTPVYEKNCTVELKKVRERTNKKISISDYKGDKNWKLEDFLKLIDNQENTKRHIGYQGKIPSSKEIATQLRAKCFDSKGTGTFSVGKKFAFYYLIDNSNK